MINIFVALNGLPDNPVCVTINEPPEAANEVEPIVNKKPNITIIKE